MFQKVILKQVKGFRKIFGPDVHKKAMCEAHTLDCQNLDQMIIFKNCDFQEQGSNVLRGGAMGSTYDDDSFKVNACMLKS